MRGFTKVFSLQNFVLYSICPLHGSTRSRTRRAVSSMQQHGEQRQQHQHTNLSSSTQFTNLTVDESEITLRIGELHRGLAILENILCNVCAKKFPFINMDTAGVCICCRNNIEVPGLYSPANNMDPGQVPPELCVGL